MRTFSVAIRIRTPRRMCKTNWTHFPSFIYLRLHSNTLTRTHAIYSQCVLSATWTTVAYHAAILPHKHTARYALTHIKCRPRKITGIKKFISCNVETCKWSQQELSIFALATELLKFLRLEDGDSFSYVYEPAVKMYFFAGERIYFESTNKVSVIITVRVLIRATMTQWFDRW